MDDAQTRRRARRRARQQAWNRAHPLSVGVRACPTGTTLYEPGQPYRSRPQRAVQPIDLNALADYRRTLTQRAAQLERRQHRLWYRPAGERGLTCSVHASQRRKK